MLLSYFCCNPSLLLSKDNEILNIFEKEIRNKEMPSYVWIYQSIGFIVYIHINNMKRSSLFYEMPKETGWNDNLTV